MHESPAANIEEVMWRWEREASQPRHHEPERFHAGESPRTGSKHPAPHRFVVAKLLVTLARRVAPSDTTPTTSMQAQAN
jgi:hypothetical protein